MNLQNIIFQTLIKALVLFTALPVHECAHAWVASKLGDPTGKYQGRITLNPLAHLDLFGSICMLLTGFGWAKPVQVNPNNFKNPKAGMAISSLAGPISNIVLAFFATIIFKVLSYIPSDGAFLGLVIHILQYMVILNIGLAVFNLLPIPPLDGSRILLYFLPQKYYFKIMQYERYIFLLLIVLMYSGVLNIPLSFLRNAVLSFINFSTGFVNVIMNVIVHGI